VCVAKFGGLAFLFFVLNSAFILRPLNFMIAMAKNLSAQKKTETELVSPAVLDFGKSIYLFLVFQESSFLYPQLSKVIISQQRAYVNGILRIC